MKKILILIVMLFTFSFAFQGFAIDNRVVISQSLQTKIDNLLWKFFKKLDYKIKSSELKTKKLEKINQAIDRLKNKYKHSVLVTNILDYMKIKIQNRINFYKKYTNTISPADYQKMLKLWFDTNWMTFDWEIKNYNSNLPKIWKQAWFSHVRIRFNEDVDINLLKRQVEDSLKVGLIPVIAFWAKDFKYNPDEESLQKAVGIWKNVAEKFKDEDYKLSFDLMIEPWKNLKKHTDMLYKFYEQVIPIIRNTWWKNKYRNIFLAPNHLADPEYLEDLTKVFDKFKDDKYLMAEFHFMAAGPFKKTNSTWKRMTWNGTWTTQERQKIIDRLQLAVDWQEKTWRKIWFGAWMPWNYNHTYDGWDNTYTIEEQVAFAKFMEETMCKMWIPNAINADHKFYDVREWKWNQERLPIIKALVDACK